MNKVVIVLTASLLGVGLTTGAWGQTSQTSPSRPSGDTSTTKRTDDKQRQAWTPDPGAVETSKLIGTRVKTADGKDVGEIDQLIVSQSDGKITHAVLGKGGMLGIGETKLVVNWSDVKLQRDPDKADRWVAMIDQAKLDSAPRYEARKDRDTAPAASPGSTPPAGRSSEPTKKSSEPAKKY